MDEGEGGGGGRGEGRVSGCRDCARLPLPQYDSVRHDCRHFFATILFPFRKDSHFFTMILIFSRIGSFPRIRTLTEIPQIFGTNKIFVQTI